MRAWRCVAGLVGLGLGGLLLSRLAGGRSGRPIGRSGRPSAAQPTTLYREGPFELRAQPPMTLVGTRASGSEPRHLKQAAAALRRYFDGRGRIGPRIAWPGPPLLVDRQGEKLRVRVIAPQPWSASTLPFFEPGVRLRDRPARRYAVRRFRGRADAERLDRLEAELRRWVSMQDQTAKGRRIVAVYDGPLPFRRRAEIWLRVEPR